MAPATGHKWKMRLAPVGATECAREISAASAGACVLVCGVPVVGTTG